MTEATITITRGDEDEEIEVSVEGSFHYVSSYDPNQTGDHLEDWSVVEPAGFQLTREERERAEQALYDAHEGG